MTLVILIGRYAERRRHRGLAVARTIRCAVAGHDLRFDSLDKRFDLVREGTMSAIGFAADASRSNKAIRDQIADLTRRVEKLEQAR